MASGEEGFSLFNCLSPELKIIVLSHLSGRDLHAVSLVSTECDTLVKTAFLLRARPHHSNVLFIQQWWRKKREDALKHGSRKRLEIVQMVIDTITMFVERRMKCLECREKLEAVLQADMGKQEMEKSSFLGIPALLADMWRGKKQISFTSEVVEKLFPLELLSNLIAPFKNFLAEAQPLVRRWEEEEKRNVYCAETQCIAPLLTQLLECSMPGIEAYLAYLQRENLTETVLRPLCTQLDLHKTKEYWKAISDTFALPGMMLINDVDKEAHIDHLHSFFINTVNGEAKGINRFLLTIFIGWGSILHRLRHTEQLRTHVLPAHPDYRQTQEMCSLLTLFLNKMGKLESDPQLCYD